MGGKNINSTLHNYNEFICIFDMKTSGKKMRFWKISNPLAKCERSKSQNGTLLIVTNIVIQVLCVTLTFILEIFIGFQNKQKINFSLFLIISFFKTNETNQTKNCFTLFWRQNRERTFFHLVALNIEWKSFRERKILSESERRIS